MKPKEWLKKHGHIQEITRGRISRDNLALIDAAVKSGVKIEGYSVSTTRPSADRPGDEPKVTKVVVSNEKVIADIGDPRYDEHETVGYIIEDGKKVEISLRTICATCHGSFTYHVCDTPRVWLDHMRQGEVYFKERTKPLPVKRW